MTYAANIRSLEPLIADRSIQFVKGDIGDAALMHRLFDEHKFTRVAHLAAESHVDRSIADPEAFCRPTCSARSRCCRPRWMPGARRRPIGSARFLDEFISGLSFSPDADRVQIVRTVRNQRAACARNDRSTP